MYSISVGHILILIACLIIGIMCLFALLFPRGFPMKSTGVDVDIWPMKELQGNKKKGKNNKNNG